jgi:hypothetical protein
MTKTVCIVLRGELLRNPGSTYNINRKNKTKAILSANTSEGAIQRQDEIMISIKEKIIMPHLRAGNIVFVSGCVYDCPTYAQSLKEHFPENTVAFMRPGHTNQAGAFMLSLEHAVQKHPDCAEYMSVRCDHLMLRDVPLRDDLKGKYTGIAWSNSIFPQVDIFFIISHGAIQDFKRALRSLGLQPAHVHTHNIAAILRAIGTHVYTIWSDYHNQRAGISYHEYQNDISNQSKRPLINYMRFM